MIERTMNKNTSVKLPKLNWKTATCEVCGKSFDYMTKRKPRTCNSGDCQYKFHYKIDVTSWATHQPNLFDAKK